MKYLFLLFFVLPAKNVFSFTHDDLVHDLAHYGSGTLVAEAVHLSFNKSDLKPWQKMTCEITAAFAANLVYELIEPKETNIEIERIACGTLGGLVFSYSWYFRQQFNYNYPTSF